MLNVHNVTLTISAVLPKQYPEGNLPEIALAGRSNVGKSSFINALLNRNNFARTSGKPGKTATLNFYNIDGALNIVDLPGYGYANASKAEIDKWAAMINKYLETREQLSDIFLLIDSRHKPTADDIVMAAYIRGRFGKITVIATKLDKLKKSQVDANIALVKQTLGLRAEDLLVEFSAVTKIGRERALGIIDEIVRLR